MGSEVTVTLTDEERALLQRYSRFYKELNDGTRSPKTAEQRRFVEVCYGRAGAESVHEIAWVKYKRIAAQERRDAALRLESQQSRMPEFEEGVPRPGWFTDDDYRKMRAADLADLKRRGRGD